MPYTRLKEEKQQDGKLHYFQPKDLNLECIENFYKSIKRSKNTYNKSSKDINSNIQSKNTMNIKMLENI